MNKSAAFYIRELATDLNRPIHKIEPVWRSMQADVASGGFGTQTELAESAAVDFDLYVGNDIPEAVFELASLAMPADD